MTEDEVKKGVQSLLDAYGLGDQIWRNNSGAVKMGKHYVRFGKVGSSDFIGFDKSGRFIGIECKKTKGKSTPEQIAFADNVRKCGGVALVVYSIDDAIAGLKENGVII